MEINKIGSDLGDLSQIKLSVKILQLNATLFGL